MAYEKYVTQTTDANNVVYGFQDKDTKEEVSTLKNALQDSFPGNPMLSWEWNQGNYTDASEDPPTSYNDNTGRIRSKIIVNVKSKLSLTCLSGYKYTYSLYVDNVRKEYYSSAWLTTDKLFEYGEGEYTLYISIARTGTGTLSPSHADDCVIILADNAVGNIYDAIEENKEDLSSMNRAAASDVGKALLVKTVENGKVTEWKFGEAGGDSVIDDAAGAGDTDKTWSANKLETEFSSVNAIKDMFTGNASMIWEWVQGAWRDLSQDPPTDYNDGATRIRTSFNIVANEKLTLKHKDGYSYVYSLYKNGTRVEYQAISYLNVDKVWTGEGTYTLYVTLRKNDNSNILPSEANNGISVLADNAKENVYNAIEGNYEAIKDVDENNKNILKQTFPGNSLYYAKWLQGAYSDVSEDPPINISTSNVDIRLHIKLDIGAKEKVSLNCSDGYQYVYSVYVNNVRKEYKSNAWVGGNKVFEYGEGTYTVYVNLKKTNGNSIVPNEGNAGIVFLADNAVVNIYDAIATGGNLSEIKNLFDPGASNTLRGYYNASNTWVTSYDFGQTDFIPVKQGVKYVSSNTSLPVLWFDSNKEFLSSMTSQEYAAQGYATPPVGAEYVKFVIPTATQTTFFVHSDEEDSRSIPLSSIPYGLYNQYKGKKGVAFGTSLTYRAKSSGGYLEYLPVMAQMDFDNQGLGNSTILEHNDHTDMMGKITEYTGYADKDVVLLEGFVNDWYDNSDKLGTWKDEGVITSTTVCGRIRYALNYILTQNPHTTLIVILDPYGQRYNGQNGCASTVVKSGYTQYEYYEEIAKLTASLGIPTIKGYAVSGMNELVSDYYIDIIHPSPLGAKQFADVIWAEMQSIPIKVK